MNAEVGSRHPVTEELRGRVAAGRSGPGFTWLVVPPLVYLVALFGLPIARVLVQSVVGDQGFTLAHYARLFAGGAYVHILLFTLELGLGVVILSLVFGYPVAYLLATTSSRTTAILMGFVLLPFWTSVMVRTFTWMVILGREGIVNRALVGIGIVDTPIQLLHTAFAVYVGLVYYLLPFMILSLYTVMKGIDPSYVRSARVLGAGPLQTFLRVYLPLSMPGVLGGSVLVFIMTIGFYITPALLGNIGTTTLPMLIEVQVNATGNWQFASALAVVLLVVTSVLHLAAERVGGMNHLWHDRRQA